MVDYMDMKKNKQNTFCHNNSRARIHFLFILAGVLLLTQIIFSKTYQTSVKEKHLPTEKGEIIVLFKENVEDEFLKAFMNDYDGQVTLIKHIENYALFQAAEKEDYSRILESFQKDDEVLVAQANHSIELLNISDDSYSDTLWAINNPGYYRYIDEYGARQKSSVPGIDMDIIEAWSEINLNVANKREVVVAVIDTGVDYLHPDLSDHMWKNINEIPDDGVDNDNNGYIDDIYGWDFYNNDSTVCHYKYSKEIDASFALPEDNDNHGTHVAGIIGAVANNGIGSAGIASNINIKIMSLKINGGRKGTGDISDAIEAVKYATKMGADICNMSWGTYDYPEVLYEVMKESDMLFVAAAGNSGTNNNDRPIYPANFSLDHVLSVTFINAKGELGYLSNYGSTSIDLAAPGQDIFSTTVGDYAFMSGSSMAAPHVTAVAAMLYAYSDYLYPANVREVILKTIKPIKNLEGYLINPGIPSAYNAIVANGSLIEDKEPPQIILSTIYDKAEMVVPIRVSDFGQSKIRVLKWLRGDKKLVDFERGMAGTVVNNEQLKVSKPDTYTLYASDYAGNEMIQSYEIKADKTSPTIYAYYTVSDDYKLRTIHTKISDEQSGIEKVEYLQGEKSAADFASSLKVTKVTLKNGKGSFKVNNDGIYTIRATDFQGNTSVSQISVKTVKATAIKLARKKIVLNEGDTYNLRPFLKPIGTTDRLTFRSDNNKLATISNSGELKAIKAGKVVITVKTSSGIKTICEVIIRKK